VDRDTFVARNGRDWNRLEELSRKGRLSADETDELVRLYLRASSHLATAGRRYRDVNLLLYLNGVVARANSVVYGTRVRSSRRIMHAVTHTFPAAVWHARRAILVSTAVFMVAFALAAVWIATTPAAADVAIPPHLRDAYLEQDFANYYSSQPAAQFAALVFTNNARIGILAFGAGMLFGVPTLLVLAYNGLNVGVAAGIFHAAGRAPLFWGLILPHGLLELTAIFVAGGSGLRLGWTLISPGDRTRSQALTDEGRRAVVIVLGLILVFLLAGLIEAFVTPSGLPTWARVGTGVLVEVAFVAYIVGYGRSAAARGYTGALGESRRAPSIVTADRGPSS